MLNEPKTVPIILKLCQHNWEKPSRHYQDNLPKVNLQSVFVKHITNYSRTLIAGQVFDSVCSQSTSKNDHIICYEISSKQYKYGVITKFVSYCELGCKLHQTPQEGYCHHKALVNQLDCSIWMTKHILAMTSSRYVCSTVVPPLRDPLVTDHL